MPAPKGIEAELRALHALKGGLVPSEVVDWARRHPASALHARFEWDDSEAAERYREWQARHLIAEVSVVEEDCEEQRVYVSLSEDRGERGYVTLASVLSDKDRRAALLRQALMEALRWCERYADLAELAGVRKSIAVARLKFGIDRL